MIGTGFIALARTTFDVPFAEATARAAFESVAEMSQLDVVGTPQLATDTEEVAATCARLSSQGIEALVVFQSTFADSTLIATVADNVDVPLVLWATPEERTGGRLRLNSFCGVNLAAYVLAREGVDYRWVYRQPSDPALQTDLVGALTTELDPPVRTPSDRNRDAGPVTLAGKEIGLVGVRPDGFEPCDYEPETLESVFGVSVDPIPITSWFDNAGGVADGRVKEVRSDLATKMTGLSDVDQGSLGSSIQLYLGLSDLVAERGWNGVATRCWPECFTQFGGAACAGNSLLTSSGTPGCCEADVYGNLTALLLQEMAGGPALVADLIDLDRETGTAVFWHCGLAPQEMAGAKPVATIHSNRAQPLLNEFPLRGGRITVCRVSQSRNQVSLVVGGGEMLDAPLPFSGTSGVTRLDSSVDDLLGTIMSEGLEHHYGIVYGDHREGLRAYAADIGIPVIEL